MGKQVHRSDNNSAHVRSANNRNKNAFMERAAERLGAERAAGMTAEGYTRSQVDANAFKPTAAAKPVPKPATAGRPNARRV